MSNLLKDLRQGRYNRRDRTSLYIRDAHTGSCQQIEQQNGIFIGQPIAVRSNPPVAAHLIAVEQTHLDVGIADIHTQQHEDAPENGMEYGS